MLSPRCPPISSDLPRTPVRPTQQDLPVVQVGGLTSSVHAHLTEAVTTPGESGRRGLWEQSCSLLLFLRDPACSNGGADGTGCTGVAKRAASTSHSASTQLSNGPSRSLCSPQTSDLGRNLLVGTVGRRSRPMEGWWRPRSLPAKTHFWTAPFL